MGSSDRGSRSFFDTFRCLGSAFITFSFGTITVRVLTLGVVSLRAIATTLWLVPMISSNAANLVSASARSMSRRMALSACCMSSSAEVFMLYLAQRVIRRAKFTTSKAQVLHSKILQSVFLSCRTLFTECANAPSHEN